MALFKMISTKGKYQDDMAIPTLINYITRSDKTPSDIIAGSNIDIDNIAESMIQVSESFNKNSGNRAYHFIVSFMPHEIHMKGLLICMANDICRYFEDEFQIVYALHEDTYYPHLHFVFNAVSYVDGHKYRSSKNDFRRLYNYIKSVLKGYYIFNVRNVTHNPETDPPHE